MSEKVILSTAYLPPVEYFSLILNAREVFIEREENYIKQSYRNRCHILAAAGKLSLTVPVLLGSFHKIPLKDIRIDYSKRWQQVHLGALNAAYRSSPYFQFYFEEIERPISSNHRFLLDLNDELTCALLKLTGIKKNLNYTTSFISPGNDENDFRYRITPKKRPDIVLKEYSQVFNGPSGFTGGLSMIDLLFNKGPESRDFL